MRRVLRWRYYCEFCKKAGMGGGHIAKHEQHCTMNPNRTCRMCVMLGVEQRPLVELIAILPNPEVFKNDEYGNFSRAFDEQIAIALPLLRKASNNCPACMMAAFRQAKIPLPCVVDFNFTEECKAIWAEINAEQMQHEYA